MPLIGETISQYQITEKIGEGAMGEVYLARDIKLNRAVALEFLPDGFAKDAQRLARFEREAQMLASLNHTNIALIRDLQEDQANAGGRNRVSLTFTTTEC